MISLLVFVTTPYIIFLDGSPNDQLLTIHWQISWLPALLAWSYASISIQCSIRRAPAHHDCKSQQTLSWAWCVFYGFDCYKKYVFFVKLCLNINIWHLLVKVGFEHCTAADFILDQCFPDFHKLKNI